MNRYTFKDGRRLRCGYTTGTCAAAAAKAAVFILLKRMRQSGRLFSGETDREEGGAVVDFVSVTLPDGTEAELPVDEISADSEGAVRCAVRKDAGDDADVTDGMRICASVRPGGSDIAIRGGEGIGRVTKPGLDQPPGEAAINSVPRRMIRHEVLEVCSLFDYEGGVIVEISVPGGEKAAEKTFNPLLGIEGGISVLGTSGIVEPMSDAAVIETIRAEMSVRCQEMRLSAACGVGTGDDLVLAAVPGNYGMKFACESLHLDPERIVKCSNFIGETLDAACEFGLSGLLLAGNAGKLIKLASGIMNTHSSQSDARIETVIACSLEAGASLEVLKELADCVTTESAFCLLKRRGLGQRVLDIAAARAARHMQRRTRGNLRTGIILFSRESGLISKAGAARELERFLKADAEEEIRKRREETGGF